MEAMERYGEHLPRRARAVRRIGWFGGFSTTTLGFCQCFLCVPCTVCLFTLWGHIPNSVS